MQIQPPAIILNKFRLPFPWQKGTVYDINVLGKDFRVIFTSSIDNVSGWLMRLLDHNDVIVGIGIEYTGRRLRALKICVDTSCLIFQLSWPIQNFPPDLITFLNDSNNTLASLFPGTNRIRSKLNALRNGLRLPKILNLSHLARDKYPDSLDKNASISDVVAECLGYREGAFPNAASWDTETITDDHVLNAATFTCAASMVADKLLADLRHQEVDQGPSRQRIAGPRPFIFSWESKYPSEQMGFLDSVYPAPSDEALGYAHTVGNGDLNTAIHSLMRAKRLNFETRSDPGCWYRLRKLDR